MTSMFDPWSDFFAPRQNPYGRRPVGPFADYDDYYAQQVERARYAEEMERRRRYAEEMERRRRYAEEMERRQRYAEEMERRQRYAQMLEQQQREAELARRQRYAAELERQKAAAMRVPVHHQSDDAMDVDASPAAVSPRRQQQVLRRQPMQKQQQQQQQQRQLLRVMTVAATIIQRAYRRHLARKREQECVEAASRIAAWYRHARDVRVLRASLPKIVALSKVVKNAKELWREKRKPAFEAPLREDGKPSRAFLELSELMLRQLLALDEISTGGNEHIRKLRKSIASALNAKLDKIEAVKQAALRDYAASQSDTMDVVDSNNAGSASESEAEEDYYSSDE